jgi:glycosyltransferase involved in cell wall biosynthesis
MLFGKKVVVVLPAYNAAKTLVKTVQDLPRDVIDDVILVDDDSSDATVKVASGLGLRIFKHRQNGGYGRNQKTCYYEAIKLGADVAVMVHPDYQYDPKLAGALASLVACGTYDAALASRIIGGGALKGGMPKYKYIANRVLTFAQNILMGCKLSEYHTGYRAFSRELIESLPLQNDADGFVFDNQMLAQAAFFGFRIGEISCPTRYFHEASSISFWPSVRYGLGVLSTAVKYRVQRWNLMTFPIFTGSAKWSSMVPCGDTIHLLPDSRQDKIEPLAHK